MLESKVKLINSTPLEVAIKAIRTCWDSNNKCDTKNNDLGPNDTNLLKNIIIKHKHLSTIEHINYTFEISGISRLCLQELARHRHASFSVKSTRYTLKELRNADISSIDKARQFIVFCDNDEINKNNWKTSIELKHLLNEVNSQDIVKYAVPECYRTNLYFTINARALRNLLELRLSPGAHFEIRKLAEQLYYNLPEEHKEPLFDDIWNPYYEIKLEEIRKEGSELLKNPKIKEVFENLKNK